METKAFEKVVRGAQLGALVAALAMVAACSDEDESAEGCTVADNGDGTSTITCGSTSTTISNGADGADGTNGEDGADGTNGTDGTDGSNGSDGVDGEDGEDFADMRNVILVIGDGMQLDHERAASRYLTGTDYGLVFHDDSVFPYASAMTTWDITTYDRYAWQSGAASYDPTDFDPLVGYDPTSGGDDAYPLNNTAIDDDYYLTYGMTWPGEDDVASAYFPCTDSASAATAMATGMKTEKGNISWAYGDEEEGEMETIAEWMRDQGGAMGVVSSVQFNHATPAAFISHNIYRSNYSDNKNGGTSIGKNIAEEIVEDVQPDVVIGAGDYGTKYLPDELRTALAANTDYVYVERTESGDGTALLLNAASDAVSGDKKLFGVFGGAGNYMEPPLPTDSPGSPSFVEQAPEDPTLAESTEAAMDVLLNKGGTDGFFLMVEGGDIDWANHPNDFEWMIGAMYNFEEAVKSAIQFVEDDSTMNWSNTMLVVTSDHGNDYMRINPDEDHTLEHGDLPAQLLDNSDDYGDYVYPDGEVMYESDYHTNELVTLAAMGAGADLFADAAYTGWYGDPGSDSHHIVDNTHIHDVMVDAYTNEGAKYLILMIGDGMQEAHEAAYSKYRYDEYDALVWDEAEDNFDHYTLCTTWDINTYNRYAYQAQTFSYATEMVDPIIGYDPDAGGTEPEVFYDPWSDKSYFLDWIEGYDPTYGSTGQPATDSASAATAMATGIKTDKGNISWMPGDPDGGEIETIGEYLRAQRGGAFGVVSTVPITHATPGAFASHNVSRGNASEMFEEMIYVVKPDVAIGGGHPTFYGSNKYVSADGYTTLTAGHPDYEFVERVASEDGGDNLAAAATAAVTAGKKLIGLFGGSGGNMENPTAVDDPDSPSVAYESENPTFADMIDAALTVLGENPKGFFLMAEQGDIDWANHANDYAWMVGTMHDLNDGVQAVIDFVDQPDDEITWDNTLVIVTSDHGNSYMRLQSELGTGDLPAQAANDDTNCPGCADFCGAYVYTDCEVTYGSGSHTNEPVMVYAKGGSLSASYSDAFEYYEGLWYDGTNLLDNTMIFDVTAEFLGVTPASYEF